MDEPEREDTTKKAIERIDEFLGKPDYISALLISSIYVHMRLRSLITDRLSPPDDKWKKISGMLDNEFSGFKRLVSLCDELHLLNNHDPEELKELWKNLKNLWDMRGNIAHESELWRKLTKEDEEKIRNLCKSAKEFLEKTKTQPINLHKS